MDPQPSEGTISVSRREGIEWDPGTSPHMLPSSSSPSSCSANMEFLLPSWAQTLTKPLVAYRTPFSVLAESSTSLATGWDPLLKLKIRDAVCGHRKSFSSTPENFRISPVVGKDCNNLVSLRNNVVRLWDINAKTEEKRVFLPKRGSNANANALTSAFDVDWDAKRAALGGVDGSLSFVDLECSAFEKSYQMQQAVVQALQFDQNSSTKIALAGQYCYFLIIILMFISTPSFAILYAMDEAVYATIIIEAIGHQLCWSVLFYLVVLGMNQFIGSVSCCRWTRDCHVRMFSFTLGYTNKWQAD